MSETDKMSFQLGKEPQDKTFGCGKILYFYWLAWGSLFQFIPMTRFTPSDGKKKRKNFLKKKRTKQVRKQRERMCFMLPKSKTEQKMKEFLASKWRFSQNAT